MLCLCPLGPLPPLVPALIPLLPLALPPIKGCPVKSVVTHWTDHLLDACPHAPSLCPMRLGIFRSPMSQYKSWWTYAISKCSFKVIGLIILWMSNMLLFLVVPPHCNSHFCSSFMLILLSYLHLLLGRYGVYVEDGCGSGNSGGATVVMNNFIAGLIKCSMVIFH